MAEKKVILYTQPACQQCNMEKAWLKQQGVPFEERNVIQSEAAGSELEELGVLTTPVTLVDDEMVVGFNQEKLKELLGL